MNCRSTQNISHNGRASISGSQLSTVKALEKDLKQRTFKKQTYRMFKGLKFLNLSLNHTLFTTMTVITQATLICNTHSEWEFLIHTLRWIMECQEKKLTHSVPFNYLNWVKYEISRMLRFLNIRSESYCLFLTSSSS